ncbi:MAG: hypothetical protein VX768_16895 [Planctomycetota bacterium]|nr:hypothetical protein [Planctomycetota bacterium]
MAQLAILLTATYSTSINVADPDLWGHVQYGQDVIADGRIHETTTYSFTAVGFRWINHENLAELTFAGIVDSIGPTGLLLFKFGLSLLVFGLVLRRLEKQQLHLLVIALSLLATANAISYFWSIRPQLFTFTFFTLMVALLNYCFHGWCDQFQLRRSTPEELDRYVQQGVRPIPYSSKRLKCLWLAPLLFFLWANSHGGFVAGVAIYVAYLGLRSVETFLRFGKHGWGLVRRFALMAAVAVLATFLNPYGPGLHQWLLLSLGQPRPEITEWAATDFFGENGWRFGLVVLASLFSILFSRKPKDFTHMVLLGLTLWQAVEHHRHVPFFSIFFAFWLPVHFQSALERFRWIQVDTDKENAARSLPVFAGAVICVLILGVVLCTRLTVIKVEKDRYPVAAFEFLKQNRIQGRMVVTYNWAQYAIAAFKQNPDVTGRGHISFDGRFRTCYPQQIVDMHFDFICGNGGPEKRFRGADSGPYDGSRILEFGKPDLVIISRKQKHSTYMMSQVTDSWSLLYQDRLTQVWGRQSVFDDPQSPRFFGQPRREISDDIQQGYAAWPAILKTSSTVFPLTRNKLAQTNR